MTNERIKEIIAERLGLTEKIEKLQRELLEIEYIVSAENYFSLRRKMVEEILETAARNGLKRTEDRIEDYGTWLYFVTKYQTSPPTAEEKQRKDRKNQQ